MWKTHLKYQNESGQRNVRTFCPDVLLTAVECPVCEYYIITVYITRPFIICHYWKDCCSSKPAGEPKVACFVQTSEKLLKSNKSDLILS